MYGLAITHIPAKRPGKFFNKPYLQNIGIEQSNGDVLTFLDVDCMVGDYFFDAAERALSPRITKVCYRVRPLAAEALDKAEADPKYLDRCFDAYDTFDPPRFEAYQMPNMNNQVRQAGPLFGNSQFSISREKLGDLRFDERFEGAGFEDIEFNKRIWEHYEDKYHATLVDDADHAILDIQNEREPDWHDPSRRALNEEMFEESCPWNVTLPD